MPSPETTPPPPPGLSVPDDGYVLAMSAPAVKRRNPLTRSPAGVVGLLFLGVMLAACLGTLPWTLSGVDDAGVSVPRYNAGDPKAGRLPPTWVPHDEEAVSRAIAAVPAGVVSEEATLLAAELGMTADAVLAEVDEGGPAGELLRERLRAVAPGFVLGSDALGRSVLLRALTGGGISLGIGVAAALISVVIGTLYGAFAGYAGGRTDAVLMRIVDVLYGLPYILLVVLLAVASDAMVERWELSRVAAASAAQEVYIERAAAAQGADDPDQLDADTLREIRSEARAAIGTGRLDQGTRTALDVVTLLIAIGGVSWLTMARVVRGQVLSLKSRPFVEAARAIGASRRRIFARHLLPNLLGPIIVYATLIVPQAILQESFLSFLGIGVKPPLPSWGNMAADGLSELNTYRSHWWLLAVPCVLLGVTLLALNFVGEGLREMLDPKRSGAR